jgi:hypothetical protein
MLKFQHATAAGIAALAEAGRQMLVNLGPAMDAEDRRYAEDLHRHATHKLANGALGAAHLWASSMGPEVISSSLVAQA